jgi:hypothetical protein
MIPETNMVLRPYPLICKAKLIKGMVVINTITAKKAVVELKISFADLKTKTMVIIENKNGSNLSLYG